eukprot:4017021-Pleurochrysis_carterae.AAC.2
MEGIQLTSATIIRAPGTHFHYHLRQSRRNVGLRRLFPQYTRLAIRISAVRCRPLWRRTRTANEFCAIYKGMNKTGN